jgi:hypothetical protein
VIPFEEWTYARLARLNVVERRSLETPLYPDRCQERLRAALFDLDEARLTSKRWRAAREHRRVIGVVHPEGFTAGKISMGLLPGVPAPKDARYLRHLVPRMDGTFVRSSVGTRVDVTFRGDWLSLGIGLAFAAAGVVAWGVWVVVGLATGSFTGNPGGWILQLAFLPIGLSAAGMNRWATQVEIPLLLRFLRETLDAEELAQDSTTRSPDSVTVSDRRGL